MKIKRKLRLASLVLLLVAVVFVFCALSAPNLGSVFYIGSLRIGVEVWRAFYTLYAVVTVTLFAASFLVRSR